MTTHHLGVQLPDPRRHLTVRLRGSTHSLLRDVLEAWRSRAGGVNVTRTHVVDVLLRRALESELARLRADSVLGAPAEGAR